MKIGYPCINWGLECRGNKTFRLRSYSKERLIETVENNLDCLLEILKWNIEHNILFFRITSDLIPFASHPVCTFKWQKHFAAKFKEIGVFIRKNDIRISMHPDQFTLINSLDNAIFKRSEKELLYHAQIIDLMGLDWSAKVQIHVGGIYGDKERSIKRFVERYRTLNPVIKKRLVIENDDKCYNVKDCFYINKETDTPILFDVFHNSVNKADFTLRDIFDRVSNTWKKKDGVPIIDYSSQERGGRAGRHAETINIRDFKKFIRSIRGYDFDVMLEIKDKEKSALKAVKAASQLRQGVR